LSKDKKIFAITAICDFSKNKYRFITVNTMKYTFEFVFPMKNFYAFPFS
jgi:hypothetical protein